VVLFVIEKADKKNLINILEKVEKRTYVQKQVGFSKLSTPLSPVIMIDCEFLAFFLDTTQRRLVVS
jgi:hypothetical protein